MDAGSAGRGQPGGGLTRTLVRARRLMMVGLVISVLGNRLAEGAFDALAASGVVAVPVMVALVTARHAAVFAFPIYSRLLVRRSPDLALIAVDMTEAGLSVVALAVALAWPQHAVTALVVRMFLDVALLPIGDVADEFYGASLAQIDESQAWAFNASLYATLGFVGLVIAGPAGALIAGRTVEWVLVANIGLSAFAAGFRLVARKVSPTRPLEDADRAQSAKTRERLGVRRFVGDIVASGPASPLIAFCLRALGALTGELLFVWTARAAPVPAEQAMAAVLAVFGVGSTIGPLLGRRFNERLGTATTLRASAWASLTGVLALIGALLAGAAGFWWGVAFVAVNETLNWGRVVVLETHRQVIFTGVRFARVMGWSHAFGAGGVIVGMQAGFWLGLPADPLPPLVIAALGWVAIGAAFTRMRLPGRSASR